MNLGIKLRQRDLATLVNKIIILNLCWSALPPPAERGLAQGLEQSQRDFVFNT
jgi:hypothetical protein